jgi:hypothetical protein
MQLQMQMQCSTRHLLHSRSRTAEPRALSRIRIRCRIISAAPRLHMQHPISLTPLPLGSSLCMAWRLGYEEED